TWSAAGRPGAYGLSPAGASPAIFAAKAEWNEGRKEMRRDEDADPAGGRGRRPQGSASGLRVIALERRIVLPRAAAAFLLGALELPALLVGQRFGLLPHAALRGLSRALVVPSCGRAVSFAFVALRHGGALLVGRSRLETVSSARSIPRGFACSR